MELNPTDAEKTNDRDKPQAYKGLDGPLTVSAACPQASGTRRGW